LRGALVGAFYPVTLLVYGMITTVWQSFGELTEHQATWHTRVSQGTPRFKAFSISGGTVWFIHAFFWLKSRNNTNAARGNTITSKITNWFHVDENINTSGISGYAV